MFSVVVAGVAILFLFSNPITELFSSGPKCIPRTPRPRINESLLAIDGVNDTTPTCRLDAYSIHVISKAPLVIYIENFLFPEEREYLLDSSTPLFEPSTVTHDGDKMHTDVLVRDSEVAVLPRDDPIRCIERRALAFQGWRDDLWLERLRTQRYGPLQHYAHHFDFGSGAIGWGRVSSFMAWVSAEGLEGGGTEFPLLTRKGSKRWCQWVECPDPTAGEQTREESGLVFKPVVGNAVFWENFQPGTVRGWDATWHAGLPVRKGVKVGLNIWSWGRLE